MYVWRVTAKRVTCSDGKEANVALFAYKAYADFWNNRATSINMRMAFQSGCYASERIKKTSGRIVLGTSTTGLPKEGAWVYENPHELRTFIDDCTLGVPDRLPRAEGVFYRDIAKLRIGG
jgi:hypothetical protein